MNIQPSPITSSQWKKIGKALAYSAGSGFTAGFVLGLAGALQTADSPDFRLVAALETAAVVGGVVGALNSLAVTVKQLFSDPSS